MSRALLVVLSVAVSTAHAAETLGRLFYTPAQRAELDALRGRKNVAPPPAAPEQPAVVPEVLSYDGIVRRSDGKTTVWINNRAVNDGKPAEDLPLAGRVRPDQRLSVTLPQAEKNIELRVGQSVEVLSGSIAEPYARRPGYARAPAEPRVAAKRETPAPVKPPADDEDEERARR